MRPMRKAAGPEMIIMVDYNQCLTPTEAVGRLRVLDDEGLTWVEEPTLAHDYTGHALVAREARTPIQCGENWWGTLDMEHAIEAHASDFVMPDVMKIGGVTGWLRAAALAHTKGIQVSSHLWPEISARLLSALRQRICRSTRIGGTQFSQSRCASVLLHFFQHGRWGSPVEKGLEGQSLTPEDQLFILMQAGLYPTATRGFAEPEARTCYERAESLCDSLNRPWSCFPH